jgi:hypothetical protein
MAGYPRSLYAVPTVQRRPTWSDRQSVNVAQDVWANELMGLIAYGVRIGLWHRTRSYLESHLFGDPTFHFTAPDDNDWNRRWLDHFSDSNFWRSQLDSPEPELRNLAVTMCDRIEGEAFTTNC